MDADVVVLRKKFKDLLGLVRTEVIGNHVDLTLGGLTVPLSVPGDRRTPGWYAVAAVFANTSSVCVFRAL